jgi:hypothetical protein
MSVRSPSRNPGEIPIYTLIQNEIQVAEAEARVTLPASPQAPATQQ